MSNIIDCPYERYKATSRDNRLPGPPGTLVSELTSQGVLGAINALVLHRLGYALGISRARHDNDSPASAILIYKTEDPGGVVFDPDAVTSLVEKLEVAGHDDLAAQVRKAYDVSVEGGDTHGS